MRKNYTLEQYAQYKADLIQCWKNDSKMVDYCLNKASAIITFDDGTYIVFEKPNIETRFCFDDSFDYDGAVGMARHASQSQDYFIQKNLEYFDAEIKKWIDDSWAVGIHRHYYCQPEETLLRAECFRKIWEDVDPRDNVMYRELTTSERQQVVDILKLEREVFIKRLHTYLKRYGMSKIKTWTYWGEA